MTTASARDTLLRPDDGDAFRHALRVVHRRTGLPVACAGEVDNDVLRLTEFLGVRTSALRGLKVISEAGLGGQALARRRPAGVNDYQAADSITHDYDGPVLAEGLRSMIAVPVTVRGSVRGVIYGASREALPLGERVADAIVDAAKELANEIITRDEVDRRVKLLRSVELERTAGHERVAFEELRELHAEFRHIAQGVGDKTLRERLRRACERLANLGVTHQPDLVQPLSPRELDVLAQVALGCTNAEAAKRLSLGAETVKAYLRSAMRKLEVHSRHEAVVAARRRGLLP